MHVPGWSSWTVDPVVIAALLTAAGLYALGYRRATRLAGARAPGVSHWLAYGSGLVVLALALTFFLPEPKAQTDEK